MLHELESRFGDRMNWWEAAPAAFFIGHLLNEIETYWETGPGARYAETAGINHNLGVYGWDLRDVLANTAETEQAQLSTLLSGGPTTLGLNPLGAGERIKRYMEISGHLSAVCVLASARDGAGAALTPLCAAKQLGKDGGIETLIVFIGANNALGTVLDLGAPCWSGPGYDDPSRKVPTTFGVRRTSIRNTSR